MVFVSDEDDHSPDDVDTYVHFLRDLKGAQQPQRAIAFAIAPTADCATDVGGTGDRYAQMTQLTAGRVLGSCQDSAAYAAFLGSVANQAFAPQDRFPLSKVPEGGVVSVRINGVNAGSGWTYDSATRSVVFSPGLFRALESKWLIARPACEDRWSNVRRCSQKMGATLNRE